MSITDLQIVNGGQTTASLFYVKRENKDAPLDDIFVQMKLVVVEPQVAAEMIPLISRYANSQNRVSEADFFSNSPFHVRLEELSSAYWCPRSPASTTRPSGSTSGPAGQLPERAEQAHPGRAEEVRGEYPQSRR